MAMQMINLPKRLVADKMRLEQISPEDDIGPFPLGPYPFFLYTNPLEQFIDTLHPLVILNSSHPVAAAVELRPAVCMNGILDRPFLH